MVEGKGTHFFQAVTGSTGISALVFVWLVSACTGFNGQGAPKTLSDCLEQAEYFGLVSAFKFQLITAAIMFVVAE